jgi:hypothetical protein
MSGPSAYRLALPMDNKITEILDGLPPRPPRSRLDPHATLIEEMRRRGWTYREIARVLAETCQVQSSPSNVYYFLRLRARKAKQARAQQAKQAEAEPFGSSKVASAQTTGRNTPSRGNLPTDVAQRIAALRNRKPLQPPPTGFAFDPDEPLRLINPERQKSDE